MKVDVALRLSAALLEAAEKAIKKGQNEFDLMEALSDEAASARADLVEAIQEARRDI